MVNTEIPKHYTASPSSFSGTPHLTINRDVTIDLDSTNAFEGETMQTRNFHSLLNLDRTGEITRSMVQLFS